MRNFEEINLSKRISRERENEGQLTVDVFQDRNHIVIQSTVAGVSSEDLDISIAKDMITIKGRRLPEKNIHSVDYFHQELYWGNFSRSIILPADIDPDNTKASMKNGILTIRLPKLDYDNGRRKIRIEE
jgi:HSP20 family protein